MLMRRTSLFLDEQIMKRMQRLADYRGVSVAAVVREALAEYVGKASPPTELPTIVGRFRSGHGDTSERVDELLWRDPHE